jgi:hypothetical protein
MVTMSGIVKLFKLVHDWKALVPMLTTLLGIVMLLIRVQLKNVLSPILVTGRKSIVLGIVTEPP